MPDELPDLHDLTMADIRELSDALLNVVVARARGGRMELRESLALQVGDDAKRPFSLVSPSGGCWACRGTSFEEAWADAEANGYIPCVAEDLNAAWALCAGLDHTVRYDSTENTNYGMIELGSYGDYEYRCFEERAETPARALTLAWCAWRKDEDADGEGE